MTISTTTSNTTAQGNGATTSFVYAFLIPSGADLIVTVTNPSGTAVNVSPALFSISGLGNPAGGTVTYPLSGPPLAAGYYITIARVLPLQQIVTIANQGNFYPVVTEQGLDNLEMQIQQENAQVVRAIQVNPADTVLPTPLPIAAVRANMLLGFDASGGPLLYTPGGGAQTSASLVTYLGPWIGAISETVAAALSHFKTVKDFGAKGDGSTDDTAAIQAALDTAGAIWFPPGTYVISSDLRTSIQYTCLFAAPSVSTLLASGTGTFTTAMLQINSSNCSVVGLMFDGNYTAGSLDTQAYCGIFSHGQSVILLRDLTIERTPNSAVSFPCTTAIEISTGITVDNVEVTNVGWYGFYFASCKNLTLVDCTAISTGNACCFFDYFSSGTALTTSCSGVRCSGFYGNRGSAPDRILTGHSEIGSLFGLGTATGPLTLSDSTFIDNSRMTVNDAGIGILTDAVNVPNQITISGCTVTSTSGPGIQVGSNMTVTGNTVTLATLAGIWIASNSPSFSQIICTGNIVINTKASSGLAYGFLLQSAFGGAAFANIIINANAVVDGRGSKQTVNGAYVQFSGVTYANVSFVSNQFAAVLGAPFGYDSVPSSSGIITMNNVGAAVAGVTGGIVDATFYNSFSLSQSSATNFTSVGNGYIGKMVAIQCADTHTTFKSGTSVNNLNFTAGSGTITASLHQTALATLGANGLWATVFS